MSLHVARQSGNKEIDKSKQTDSVSKQLFGAQELESIRLFDLRQKRKELEDKLRSVSNRLNFRRKKEEDELRKYMRSEERARMLSETQQFRKTSDQLREELLLRSEFETRKKARQVECFRSSQGRRLQMVGQSVKDRKILQSQKVRRLKKSEEEVLQAFRESNLQQRREKHEEIQNMKRRQAQKRKCFWFQKRLTLQQRLAEDTQIYEQQIQQYHAKIQQLRDSEDLLRKKEEHAAEVLRCAEQNYHMLKQV